MRVFQRSEHEWLRLAVTANCDPATLEALTQEPAGYGMPAAFDWNDLMHVATSHHADGVVAWRAGRWPEYQEWLRSKRDVFMPVTARMWDRLKHLRVYLHGFPMPYLALGMAPEWGRDNRNVDFMIHPDDWEGMLEALEIPRERATLHNMFSPWQHQEGGIETHCDSAPPEVGKVAKGWTFCEPMIFDHLEEREVYGIQVLTAKPEIGIALRAFASYDRYTYPHYIPLMDLADVANLITTMPDFDWSLTLAFLRRLAERDELGKENLRRRIPLMPERLPKGKSRAWGEQQAEVGKLIHGVHWDRRSPLADILWIWHFADRVYGCFPPEQMKEIEKIAPRVEPIVAARDDAMPVENQLLWPDDPTLLTGNSQLCLWDKWPGDERFLFELSGRYRVTDRVADGVWKRLGPPTDYPWTDVPEAYWE